jgi:hypothetical protein
VNAVNRTIDRNIIKTQARKVKAELLKLSQMFEQMPTRNTQSQVYYKRADDAREAAEIIQQWMDGL